jgi:DNA/RNA-binding domain of Phe-tRNA-synthetase-like protein
MDKFFINDKIAAKYPDIQLGCVACSVKIKPQSDELRHAINKEHMALRNTLKIESIRQLPAISASRSAYKAFGKDPARYRLSAEALLRRIVKGGQLYPVNNVVDLVNLASFSTGFSIGGYDSDKIYGNVELDIGKEKEPYQAIGRGVLNIENLPVLRDSKGAFGTPTSDSERTSVSDMTQHFLMVYFDFGTNALLAKAIEYAVELLEKYADASKIQTAIIKS